MGEAWRDIRHILIPLMAILAARGFMLARQGNIFTHLYQGRRRQFAVVGFAGDMIGLRVSYLISAARGLAGLPFIRMLPRH